LGLNDLLERTPSQLSGGQRQRVAMGRAIVRDPAVFLFDEPLSNLDAKLRVEMRTELLRVHRATGATSVYVTHDQVEAMSLSDRVAVMKKGQIVQLGHPITVYEEPADRFVGGFIGSPPMNFIPTSLAESNGSLYAEANGLRLKVPVDRYARLAAFKGQTVTLGIRPEDLRVSTTGDSSDQAFDAVVDVVEPLGSEILLDVTVAGQSVVARVEPSMKAKPHEKIRMAFAPERIHFFDAKTEAVIK
jgi:multiple sugar transport system ATP-binding protein